MTEADRSPGIVSRLFARMMTIPYTPYLFLLVPLLVAALRLLLEQAVSLRWGTARPLSLEQLLDVYAGYLLLHLCLALAYGIAAGRDARDFMGPVAVGLVLAWLAPLFDLFLPLPGRGHWYQYALDFSWTFASPQQPLGEVLNLWVAVAASFVFLHWLTRSVWRAGVGAILAYAALQVFLWGHYALARALAGVMETEPARLNILSTLLLGLLVYVAMSWRRLGASLARVNHTLPFFAATAIGCRMAGVGLAETGARSALMAIGFLLVIVANDWFDRDADAAVGGAARPVAADDATVAMAFQLALTAWVGATDANGLVPVALFFGVWAAYHLPALRFKRLFCLGYKTEGVAAACCFIYGAQANPATGWEPWRLIVAALLLGGFALGSSFKDYKDIAQDRAARVGTIYTRYLAQGRSLRGVHTFVAVSLILMLLVPAVWLAVRGDAVWKIVLLALAAPVPGAILLAVKAPRAAVEAGMWALGAVMLVLAATAPVLGQSVQSGGTPILAPSGRLPAGQGIPLYRLPAACTPEGGAALLTLQPECDSQCCARSSDGVCLRFRGCDGTCGEAGGARRCPTDFLLEVGAGAVPVPPAGPTRPGAGPP